jgi:hypothetical protein
LDAPIVTVNVPAAVGVPLMTPVLAFRESPDGRPEAVKLVGKFVAVIEYEKAEPTVADSLFALVIDGASGSSGTVIERTAALLVAVPAMLLASTL